MVVVKRPCCLFCFDLRACMATQRSFPVVVPASRTPAHVLVRPGTSHSHNLLATVFFFSFLSAVRPTPPLLVSLWRHDNASSEVASVANRQN